MNDIVIFGKGTCGSATAAIFKDAVEFHDPPKGLNIDDYKNFCYAIITVPTDEDEKGLNYSVVEDCYEKLFRGGFSGIVLLRSTCDPAFLQKISEIYEKTVYWPEFLTEANAEHDALNPKMIVLGTEDKSLIPWIERLFFDHLHGKGAKWHITDISSAGLIKLGINTALAAKITMFNSLHDVCEIFGANWDDVWNGVTSDERIGQAHTQVPGPDGTRGFGGKCLPKDSNALSILAKQNVYLESIRLYNNKIRSETN